MDEMKSARKLTYDYHYWFYSSGRDRYGIRAKALFNQMEQWLENTLDVCDYSAKYRYGRFTIDFRDEQHYSFFALCWDSQVEDYYESCRTERAY